MLSHVETHQQSLDDFLKSAMMNRGHYLRQPNELSYMSAETLGRDSGKKAERFLAADDGSILLDKQQPWPNSHLRGGQLNIDFNDLHGNLRDQLLDARTAGPFAAEKSENLVAGVRTEWQEGLLTTVARKVGGEPNPRQAFSLVLMGNRGSRAEAVASGFVKGNKIVEMGRVEAVAIVPEDIKLQSKAGDSTKQRDIRDRGTRGKEMTPDSIALLKERGCPEKLIDVLNELFRTHYDSQMDGVFTFFGIYVDPTTKEYVLRGRNVYKAGGRGPWMDKEIAWNFPKESSS